MTPGSQGEQSGSISGTVQVDLGDGKLIPVTNTNFNIGNVTSSIAINDKGEYTTEELKTEFDYGTKYEATLTYNDLTFTATFEAKATDCPIVFSTAKAKNKVTLQYVTGNGSESVLVSDFSNGAKLSINGTAVETKDITGATSEAAQIALNNVELGKEFVATLELPLEGNKTVTYTAKIDSMDADTLKTLESIEFNNAEAVLTSEFTFDTAEPLSLGNEEDFVSLTLTRVDAEKDEAPIVLTKENAVITVADDKSSFTTNEALPIVFGSEYTAEITVMQPIEFGGNKSETKIKSTYVTADGDKFIPKLVNKTIQLNGIEAVGMTKMTQSQLYGEVTITDAATTKKLMDKLSNTAITLVSGDTTYNATLEKVTTKDPANGDTNSKLMFITDESSLATIPATNTDFTVAPVVAVDDKDNTTTYTVADITILANKNTINSATPVAFTEKSATIATENVPGRLVDKDGNPIEGNVLKVNDYTVTQATATNALTIKGDFTKALGGTNQEFDINLKGTNEGDRALPYKVTIAATNLAATLAEMPSVSLTEQGKVVSLDVEAKKVDRIIEVTEADTTFFKSIDYKLSDDKKTMELTCNPNSQTPFKTAGNANITVKVHVATTDTDNPYDDITVTLTVTVASDKKTCTLSGVIS